MSDQYRSVANKFDRAAGSLTGLPDVVKTAPATVVAAMPIVGDVQTFIVQTFRQREVGDTIFVQYVDGDGGHRFVLPPQVADAIARQRDALTTKNRKRAAKEQAEARKARGELPGFMRAKKKAGAK